MNVDKYYIFPEVQSGHITRQGSINVQCNSLISNRNIQASSPIMIKYRISLTKYEFLILFFKKLLLFCSCKLSLISISLQCFCLSALFNFAEKV